MSWLIKIRALITSGLSRSAVTVAIATIALCLASWVITPAAWALVQIKLTDLSYHECSADLAEGAITAGGTSMAANCFIVTGKANNPSGKHIVNADIFGRIYDANYNPVIQNRTRLGSIDEVPPGVSNFELRISVPVNQPTPLKLEQFKASGFTGVVRR
jgi:hypothetical protein